MKKLIILFVVFFVSSTWALAETITPIGEIERGMSVTIQGKVVRILDVDEFRMEDETGSVKVYIGWKNRVVMEVGETVTVRGIVDDDLVARFRPEVYAFEVIREDGTALELRQ